MDEPTAWEDINPTMALAPQRGQQISSSERLRPATSEAFKIELTACLALVTPVGMTEEAKREWLAVAWATLSHLPADLLTEGCKVARQTCDHPSKIVPTIIEATKERFGWRRDSERDVALSGPLPQLPKPDYVTPEQAAEILQEYGIKSKRVA